MFEAAVTFTVTLSGVFYKISAGDVVAGGHPCFKARPDLFVPSGTDKQPDGVAVDMEEND